MGADCCKSSGANTEGERNMLSRDPAENEIKTKDDSSGSDEFVLRVDGKQFFSLIGNGKKKPGKKIFSTEKDAYAALYEAKPLKNITIQTLIENNKDVQPNPGEFLNKELFGNNPIKRLSLENRTFFSPQAENTGETAFIFLYYALFKNANKIVEDSKKEVAVNFFSENNYDDRNTVNYESFAEFINQDWINTPNLQNIRIILFNEFSAVSKSIDLLIQNIRKLKSKSIKSFELGLKTFNEYPNPSGKELALFKAISKILADKPELEIFSLLLHTSDNQNKILNEVGELIKSTQKLREFNLFLRTLTSSANFVQFTENILSKLSQIKSFSLGFTSADDKPEANISDSNLRILVESLKRGLPSSMDSFSFFVSTYKGILDASLAIFLEFSVLKTFNGFNLALEGKYSNYEDIGEQIKQKVLKQNPKAEIGILSLDT